MTIMVLVNQYDDIVCELERDKYGFWKIPQDVMIDCLCAGDEFKVKELWTED